MRKLLWRLTIMLLSLVSLGIDGFSMGRREICEGRLICLSENKMFAIELPSKKKIDMYSVSKEDHFNAGFSYSKINNKFVISKRDKTWKSSLYVIDVCKDKMQELFKSSLDCFYPSWSPDGKRISFLSPSGDGDTYRLYITDFKNPNPKCVINLPIRGKYSWSPDSNYLLVNKVSKQYYSKNSYSYKSEIVILDLYNGDYKKLTDGWYGVWRPNSEKIIYKGGDGIYSINSDGRNNAKLLSLSEVLLANMTAITCSPDGNYIAFYVYIPELGFWRNGFYLVSLKSAKIIKKFDRFIWPTVHSIFWTDKK